MYDDHTCAAIGKYATFHGVAPASCFFSPELILNWNQTGIKTLPIYTWTMAPKGSKRVEMVGLKDKCLLWITGW